MPGAYAHIHPRKQAKRHSKACKHPMLSTDEASRLKKRF